MRGKWISAALALVAVLAITTAANATVRGMITGKMIAPHSITSKHFVNHTIQAHDLSKALISSLRPPGTALAYAHVLYDAGTASFDAAQTHGMGSATVMARGQGGFCFANLPFTPHNATVTVEWRSENAETGIAQVVIAPDATASGCSSGEHVRVATVNAMSGTEAHYSFYIAFN